MKRNAPMNTGGVAGPGAATAFRRMGPLTWAVLALCSPLAAQTAAPPTTQSGGTTPPAAPQVPSAPRVGPVAITGSVRVRGEGWDWFAAPGYDDRYAFGASLLRVAAMYSGLRLEAQVELAQPTLLGLPGNAVAPAPQGQLGLGATYRAASGSRSAGLFLKQAFIRLRGLGSPSHTLRLGRLEFSDGTETTPADPSLAWLKAARIGHRMIGNFGFSHVQRSFDAVHAARDAPRLNLTFFAGRPTEGVFQLDGQGWIRDIDVQYASGTLPAASGEARLFAMRYHDGRGTVPTDNRPAELRSEDRESIEVYTLGGHLLRIVPLASGTVDLLVWGAVQSGDWGTQRHRAHAYAVEAGFQPALPFRPWFRMGVLVGSGDAAPESELGGEHRSFFQVLPTPRIYARTPFYNLMNSEDYFVQVVFRPDTHTSVRADVHRIRLAEAGDLWYAGGGAFDPKGFGFAGRPSGGVRHLATTFDLSVDRQLGARTAVSLYLGRVQGGAVISQVHPSGSNAHYAYLELTRRF